MIFPFLPADFDTDYLIPSTRTPVPESVHKMITAMVEVARYHQSTYDDVSETRAENFNEKTAGTTSTSTASSTAGPG